MHEAAFSACGIQASYVAVRASRAQAVSIVQRLREDGYAGFNVTTPLKESIVKLVDVLTTDAAQAGAVNTVACDDGQLRGHNTDGAGLINALKDVFGWSPCGRIALILGSGPAARAFGCQLRNAGAMDVQCWSRNIQSARVVGSAPEGRADLVVSALPHDALLPDSVLSSIGRMTRVFDSNYAAPRSPIPPNVGGPRSDGLPLLVHQGALAFRWWTGLKPPLEVMRAAVGLTRF